MAFFTRLSFVTISALFTFLNSKSTTLRPMFLSFMVRSVFSDALISYVVEGHKVCSRNVLTRPLLLSSGSVGFSSFRSISSWQRKFSSSPMSVGCLRYDFCIDCDGVSMCLLSYTIGASCILQLQSYLILSDYSVCVYPI